jgi:hypothetical protein
VLLTDFPLGDKTVNAINVTIKRVEIHRDGFEWETIVSYENADGSGGKGFELLALTGGVMAVLGERELPEGLYTQIRMVLGDDNTIVVDGVETSLSTPSAEQTGIKLTGSFDVSSSRLTVIKLDFDAQKSVIQTGEGQYKLKPTVSADVEYLVSSRWPLQYGTSGSDFASGIASPPVSGIYVAGYTDGDLGGYINAGANDFMVVRYDGAGNERWLITGGTAEIDRAQGVVSDSLGNVYVVGETRGDLAGTGNGGANDLFVAKYAEDGTLQWIRQLGSAGEEIAYGAAADGTDNVYVTGATGGSLDGNTASGGFDAFLAKYDTDGNRLWTRQLGSLWHDRGQAVATDPSGNVFVVGCTAGALGTNVNQGENDAFVAKYDENGVVLWIRQLGTPSGDNAFGAATDSSGNIFVVGDTRDSLPGNTSAGGIDSFAAKYNSDGALQWVRQIGSDNFEFATDVATDIGGNAYIAGYTGGVLDGIAPEGSSDMYLIKFDALGNKLWTRLFGTPYDDRAAAISIDPADAIYLAGATWGSYGSYDNAGEFDVLIAKFDSDGDLE